MENKKRHKIKIRLENEINRFQTEIEVKKNSLILNFDELIELLKSTDKEDQTQCIYLNRFPIQKILLDEDKLLEIKIENINYNGIKSLFYLALSITNDKYVLNYSYGIHFINEIYEKIKEEGNDIKKLILYILLRIIYENYNNLNNTTESNENDNKDETSEEIKDFLDRHFSLLDNFDECGKPIREDVEDIYIKIIISLIREKKFDNCNYNTAELLEQLDMENIELTNKMFIAFKKEFDDNSSKEYLDSYKIKNEEDLDNETILNFYNMLFKYLFKNPTYLYNIQFLLDSQNSVRKIINSNYFIIKQLLKDNLTSLEEKKKFVLIRLLDSEYYSLKTNSSQLIERINEILKYYQNFHQSQIEKIEELKEIIKNKNLNKAENYMKEYENAKKKNKRYKLYKYIYEELKTKNKKVEEFNKFSETIDTFERAIHEKKTNIQKIKLKDEIFNFFSDEENKDYIKEIFKKDEIDLFMKIYNIFYNVRKYFINYLFETKKEDIKKIELTINNKEKYELDEYLEYLEIAKKKNPIYPLISKIFAIDEKNKREQEIELKFKEWEDIEKNLQEKNFDIKDDNIKIRLFIFFNEEKNKESHKKILNEESYKFLLEKKSEAEEIIINYYKTFYPETKKDKIENRKFNDKDYEQYKDAKNMKLKEPIIFSLIDEKKELKENEILEIKEKWEKIENSIKERHFENIDEKDRQKIIKFFEKKEEEKNKFIKEIFNEETIEAFIKSKNFQNKEKLLGRSKGNKKNKKKQKGPDKSEITNNINKGSITEEESTKSNTHKNELSEQSEYLKIKESSRQYEYILEKDFQILFSLKDKVFEIESIKIGELYYGENYLNILKEYFLNESDSIGNELFQKLEDLKNKLIDKYTNNFKLIIELNIKKFYRDFSLEYKLWSPNLKLNADSSNPSMEHKISNILSDSNSVSKCFEELLKVINNPIYSKNAKKKENDLEIQTNNINNQQMSSNSQNNQNDIMPPNVVINPNISNNADLNQITQVPFRNASFNTSSLVDKTLDNQARINKGSSSYTILTFERVIGSHFENRRINAVEFVKELEVKGKYVSVGGDKIIKIYDKNFDNIKEADNQDIKDWIYDFYEKKPKKEKEESKYRKKNEQLYYFACTNKEIYSLKSDEDKGDLIIENNWEVPNMTCKSVLYLEYKEKIVQPRNKKRNKNNNNNKIEYKEYDYLIVAGSNGVICFVDIFGDKTKGLDNFSIIKGGTYRGLHQISDTRIAITSNSIMPEGTNKIIIYNFASNDNKNNGENKDIKKGKIEFEFESNDEENYSFIASNSGMAHINENILLCACKKYNEEDKNGILMVTITNENNEPKFKKKFIDTGEFEVYCFCPIKDDKISLNITAEVNDYSDHYSKYKKDIFFVGGFDNILGEGRIKLFKLVKEKNVIKDIKFLQDVEIEKTGKMELIEPRTNQKKMIKIKVFNGAISSLIQSTRKGKILASCYDGRVYLLSKPNLEKYNE